MIPDPPMTLHAQAEHRREGRLIGYACTQCDEQRLTPMVRCTNGHARIAPKEFATEGVVETYTIQHVAAEAFMNEVPFAWAIIQLDDGPRVSGWIPFVARTQDLLVGARVRYTPSYKPGMMFESV